MTNKNTINDDITSSIVKTKEKLRKLFSNNNDFVIKEILLTNKTYTTILVTYLDGMVDVDLVNQFILDNLLSNRIYEIDKEIDVITYLKKYIVNCRKINEITTFSQAVKDILEDNVIIYIDGETTGLSINLTGFKTRSISEPITDAVIRGPREGFTEVLSINKTMIRRKIRNINLKFEDMELGNQTNTKVSICYMKDIVDNNILEIVKKRLNKIDTDIILESRYIEELIEDTRLQVFPTLGSYEKPDTIAAKILEGKVAILCDGTPFVLTAPYLFVELFQNSEDYYSKSITATFYRIIRVISFFISTTLPALYLSLVSFHPEVIPFKLLVKMTSAREGIPYSVLTEAIFMLFTFELLNEAGIRIPRAVGSTVSMVGALVLGQSAVQAGLVSTPMVIVVATTAIASFIVNPLLGSVSVIRIILLVIANFMGLLGILGSYIIILTYLSTINSFGIPYLYPFSPLNLTKLKRNIFIRESLKIMNIKGKIIDYNKKSKYANKNHK